MTALFVRLWLQHLGEGVIRFALLYCSVTVGWALLTGAATQHFQRKFDAGV